jgi:hypothetical protein
MKSEGEMVSVLLAPMLHIEKSTGWQNNHPTSM